MNHTRNIPRKQVILLGSLAVGMFGFAFALVPLYEIFCELTGLNGKTSGRAADAAEVSSVQVVNSEREVTIQFLANVGNGMPWEFRPTEHQLRIRPGEINTTDYYARNRAAQAVTGQAVPSVSPGNAARHLHKIECFCFTQQRLEAGEDQHMTVKFYIDDELPEDIRTLTLSYTLYKVPEEVPKAVADAGPAVQTASPHAGHASIQL